MIKKLHLSTELSTGSVDKKVSYYLTTV